MAVEVHGEQARITLVTLASVLLSVWYTTRNVDVPVGEKSYNRKTAWASGQWERRGELEVVSRIFISNFPDCGDRPRRELSPVRRNAVPQTDKFLKHLHLHYLASFSEHPPSAMGEALITGHQENDCLLGTKA